MNTKKLLSIAIIAALPFGATADYTYVSQNTPAPVANNGTVTRAYNGPYQTITPGADDDKHIASTKYVIGAYNDTIAAINRVNELLNYRQVKFYDNDTETAVESDLYDADNFVRNMAAGPSLEDFGGIIASAYAVASGIKSQRVEVYTNWDDDDETTDVALKTVVPED